MSCCKELRAAPRQWSCIKKSIGHRLCCVECADEIAIRASLIPSEGEAINKRWPCLISLSTVDGGVRFCARLINRWVDESTECNHAIPVLESTSRTRSNTVVPSTNQASISSLGKSPIPLPTKYPVEVSGITKSSSEDMVPRARGARVACRWVVARAVRLAVMGAHVFERGVTTQSSTREIAKLVTAAHDTTDRTVREGRCGSGVESCTCSATSLGCRHCLSYGGRGALKITSPDGSEFSECSSSWWLFGTRRRLVMSTSQGTSPTSGTLNL